jgi:hypothetical protein
MSVDKLAVDINTSIGPEEMAQYASEAHARADEAIVSSMGAEVLGWLDDTVYDAAKGSFAHASDKVKCMKCECDVCINDSLAVYAEVSEPNGLTQLSLRVCSKCLEPLKSQNVCKIDRRGYSLSDEAVADIRKRLAAGEDSLSISKDHSVASYVVSWIGTGHIKTESLTPDEYAKILDKNEHQGEVRDMLIKRHAQSHQWWKEGKRFPSFY